MTFARDNGPASAGALADFESKLGGLPYDYREFIAAHNGVELSGVASLSSPERWHVDTIKGIEDTEFWQEDYPIGTMPVATDGTGNTYLMVLVGEFRGRIHFLDHELAAEAQMTTGQLSVVAESFADFLSRIQDFDPEDPEDEKLFHLIAERRRKIEEQRQGILSPTKPWWKIW